MPRRHAIAKAFKRAKQTNLILHTHHLSLMILRYLRVLRLHHLIHLTLRHLLGRDLARNVRSENFLITPLPTGGESLPTLPLLDSLTEVALEIIDFRLETGNLIVSWTGYDG